MLILQGAKHKGPTLETMNVVISPSVKKTSDRLDPGGNIRHRDGSIEPIDSQSYVPSKEEIEKSLKKTGETPQEVVKEVVQSENKSEIIASDFPFSEPSKYGLWKGRTLESMSREELYEAITQLGKLYKQALENR